MERNLIVTALLAIAAAVLFDPNTATLLVAQLGRWAVQLDPAGGASSIALLSPVLLHVPKALAICCLITIPVVWLKPH